MKTLKKIGYWFLFFIVGYLLTRIILAIAFILPVFAYLYINDFQIFWFLLLGGVFLTIYYWLTFGLMVFLLKYLNEKKPDYWVSNIFLILTSVTFFYQYFLYLQSVVYENLTTFKNFKELMLIFTILPVYLKIIYISIIYPFLIKFQPKTF
jgi:hypothetical protein